MRCPKCKEEEKVKNGFNDGISRSFHKLSKILQIVRVSIISISLTALLIL